MAGLTLRQYARAKKLPINFLKKLGLRTINWQGKPAVRIPYLDLDGSEVRGRVRVSMGRGGYRWEPGPKPVLYGLWRLGLKKHRHEYICLVEGESDCHTLWERIPRARTTRGSQLEGGMGASSGFVRSDLCGNRARCGR